MERARRAIPLKELSLFHGDHYDYLLSARYVVLSLSCRCNVLCYDESPHGSSRQQGVGTVPLGVGLPVMVRPPRQVGNF